MLLPLAQIALEIAGKTAGMTNKKAYLHVPLSLCYIPSRAVMFNVF